MIQPVTSRVPAATQPLAQLEAKRERLRASNLDVTELDTQIAAARGSQANAVSASPKGNGVALARTPSTAIVGAGEGTTQKTAVLVRPTQSERMLADLVPLLAFDDLFAEEPEAKLVIPMLGIAPGPPHLLVSQFYLGKTFLAYALGLAVASGKDALGVWRTRRGRWFHMDHEQGRRHTKKRLVRMMRGMGIDLETVRDSIQIAIYPRLNATTPGAEELYTRLFTGFDFVTIDALHGLTPGVNENETEMRDYLDMLARVSEATGAAVLVIHHTGKSDATGQRPRKEMARGSSAITDAVQSVFVMTGKKGEAVRVSHEKTRELVTTVDDFNFEIVDVAVDGDPHGGLRVEHRDREQLPQQKDDFDTLVTRVVQVVADNPDSSKRIIRAKCKGRVSDVDAALEHAVTKGLVRNHGNTSCAIWRVAGGGS